MVQLLIQWLPQQVGAAALLIAIGGAVSGAVLWLTGARFSRTLIGLAMVAIGAVVGLLLPRWMGWSISGAGPAVGLALAGGAIGYAWHRLWIGVGLGAVLAAWAFLATWVSVGAPADFGWSAGTSGSFLGLWQSLPANVAQLLPITCGAAMMTGLIFTIFWPRLAVATAWSAAGASMLTGIGAAAMEFGRPQWISLLPRHLSSQTAAMVLLVMIGALLQWKPAEIAVGHVGGGGGASGSEEELNDDWEPEPAPRPVSEGAD